MKIRAEQLQQLEAAARTASEHSLLDYFMRYMTPHFVSLGADARLLLCRCVIDFAESADLTSAFELGKLLELHVEYGLDSILQHPNDEIRTILFRLDLSGEDRLYVLSELLLETSE